MWRFAARPRSSREALRSDPGSAAPQVLDTMQAGIKEGLAEIERRVSHTTSSIGCSVPASSSPTTTSPEQSPATWASTDRSPKKPSTAGSRLDANGNQLVHDVVGQLAAQIITHALQDPRRGRRLA